MSLTSMRHYAKTLRRSGRAQPVFNALQYGWNSWKSSRDYMLSNKVLSRFGDETSGKEIPELVDAIMHRFDGVLAPIQNQNELTRWIERVAGAKPKVVVEIGTAKGGTFILMSRVAAPDATLVSIDMPGGFYGGGYARWKEDFFRKLINEKQSVSFVRANSHDLSTRGQLEKVLAGRKIDVLFIDGDHSYAGAKHDFLQYSPLVRSGGLIGLHDILPNRYDPDIQVARLWEEIKREHSVEEIVDRGDQGQFGIGVVVAPVASLSSERGAR